MSDDRETQASRAAASRESAREASKDADAQEGASGAGAPVEEAEASDTDILAAVKRSREQADEVIEANSDSDGSENTPGDLGARDRSRLLGSDSSGSSSASESKVAATTAAASSTDTVSAADAAERARREEFSSVDTELDLSSPGTADSETTRVSALDDLPTAAASPARDGEIRISEDHPMAALYMQTPVPPDIRGNRGAGVIISLVATLGFAIVYAGVLALWLAPIFPASTFFSEGLIPWLTSWVFIAAVVAFFVGLVIIVMLVGRAGWWAYVLGGFFVAGLVWAAAIAALAIVGTPYSTPEEMLPDISLSFDGASGIIGRFGFSVPALAAAIVAREASVWFGAWIGARGRRVKSRNATALADYEAALSEVQAKK